MTNLKTGNLVAVAVLSASLIFSGMLISETGAEDNNPKGEMAFIDLSKVLNSHKGLMIAEKEITDFLKQGETEIKKTQKEMEDLQNELMVYSTDSPEYINGQNELERMELLIKQQQRALVMERNARMGKKFKDAYMDIERAVGEYSGVHGLRAVFTFTPGIEQMESNHPEDILKWVSMVEVVWNDDSLDITDAIITIINGS